MSDDPWYNLLRMRLRNVPKSQREKWSDEELQVWAGEVSTERAIVERKLTLPALSRIKEICSELIGPDASE